jgi:hypothetical protein
MESGDVAGIVLSLVAGVFLAIVIVLFVLSCMYYLGGVHH